MCAGLGPFSLFFAPQLMRRGTGGSLGPQPPWNRSIDSIPATASPVADGKGETVAPRNGEKEMCDQVSGCIGGTATCGSSSSLDAWLLSEFQSECRLVRRALQGDFNKALNDGKPLIVEGVHLDPGQLLKELQELGIVILPVEPVPVTPASSNPSGLRSPPPPLATGELPGVEDEDLHRGGGSGRRSSPVPQPVFPPSLKAGSTAATADTTAGVLSGNDIPCSPRVRWPSPLGNSAGPQLLLAGGTPLSDGEQSAAAARKQQQQGRLCQKHVSWGAVAEQSGDQDGADGEPEAGVDEGEVDQDPEATEENGHKDGEGEGEERRRGEGGKAARRPRWRHALSRAATPAAPGSAAAAHAPQRRRALQASAAGGVGLQLPSHDQDYRPPGPGWEWRRNCLDDTIDGRGGEGVSLVADSRGREPVGCSELLGEHTGSAQGTSGTVPAGAVVQLELRPGRLAVDAQVALRLRIMEERRPAGQEALVNRPVRVRIDAALPSNGPPRPANLSAAVGSPYQLPGTVLLEAEELDAQGSPEQCRSGGASAHGDSSPRASTYNLDDGASDVNNYGDADTDGAASGGCSPLRGTTPPPRTVAAASPNLDDSFPPIRRAKSHPVISTTSRTAHEQGKDEAEAAAMQQRQETEVVLQDVVVESGDEVMPGGAIDAAMGKGSGGSLIGTAAQVTVIDGAEAATAVSTTASVRGEAVSGATGSMGWGAGGSGGGGGTAARPLDRAHSHQMLLSAGSSRHASGGTARQGISHHLQQSCNPGFYRYGSLSTMDLHSFRSSLAGILRMGSVVHGSRLSPSPRLNRVTLLDRAGSSCGASPSVSGSAAREELLSVVPQQHQEPQPGSYISSAQQNQNHRIDADGNRTVEPGEALLWEANSGMLREDDLLGEMAYNVTPVQPARLRPAASAAGAVAGIIAAGEGPEAAKVEIVSEDWVSTPAPVKQSRQEAHVEGGPGTSGTGGGAALPPLFVPVVLCMSEADHRLAIEDNTAVCDRGGGGTDSTRVTASGEGLGKGLFEADGPEPEELLRRAQTIQEYLCNFESQGMPVLNVRYGNFGEALDVLHEYVLMCIQAAMEQLNESRARDGDMGTAAAVATVH
ncbi:hypothetical protein Vretimale_18925 [Volvox reticuliferus]|uniref:Uncharacterized protein n=1 Tax=Volvox reticuliferus TaxID=1737510 RepID=A0A8J4CZ95_9CHLO|nr:hypothetical protein Vretifemale_17255 [Volvox reticuliferus]GIM16267.1 hypothetical protein Vretimale_18925 [Volvox reticuliferus]